MKTLTLSEAVYDDLLQHLASAGLDSLADIVRHSATTQPQVRVSVAVVVRLGDSVLMTKRIKEPGAGLWGLIGGKSEPGETWEQTAARELQEEVGLSASTFKQLGWVNYSAMGKQYIVLFVAAMDWAGIPDNLEPDTHSELKFVSLADIDRYEVFEPLLLKIKTGGL